MGNNKEKFNQKEREAQQKLEERFTRQGDSKEEAERKSLQATNSEPGGGKKSDTRTGDRRENS
jgi:hypothetical protein